MPSLQVGSVPGAELSSNWWDKAFNLAADNIQVEENDKVGVDPPGVNWLYLFFCLVVFSPMCRVRLA
jgi:hypothetical protein